MSESSEVAEGLLAMLDASVIFLRTTASQQLDFAAVLRIERAALARKRSRLAECSYDEGLPESFMAPIGINDDATDELIHYEEAAPQGQRPLDEGDEGVADDLNALLSDESAMFDESLDSATPVPVSRGAQPQADARPKATAAPLAFEGTPQELQGEEEVLPDYLLGLDEPTQSGPEAPAPYVVGAFAGDDLSNDDLVSDDTLVPADEPAEDDDLPEYLRGVAPSAPAKIRGISTNSSEEDEDDLPDYLKGVGNQEDDAGEDALDSLSSKPDPMADLERTRSTAAYDSQGYESDFGDDDLGHDEDVEVTVPRTQRAAEVESFDLIGPDLDGPGFDDEVDTQVVTTGLRRELRDETGDDPSESEVLSSLGTSSVRPAAPRAAAPQPQLGAPRVSAVAGVSAGPRADVTAGLYGGPNVPTIRDRDEPKPRAAAVQINAAVPMAMGGPLEEEEELLEIGAIEDYEDDFDESEYDNMEGDGLSISVEEYEEVAAPSRPSIDTDEPEEMPAPPPPRFAAPSNAEIKDLFERAAAATEEGQTDLASDLYSDLLDADPDNIDALVARGRLYLIRRDFSRAMSDFVTAEDLDPASPEPQIGVGDLYFERKDYRKAIEYFDAALKMSPNHAMAFCRRGISHYYRKAYAEAVADLERAQKIDGEIPNIRTYVAMAKKKVGSR